MARLKVSDVELLFCWVILFLTKDITEEILY